MQAEKTAALVPVKSAVPLIYVCAFVLRFLHRICARIHEQCFWNYGGRTSIASIFFFHELGDS